MAATVYIIRHAEAEGNIYRRCHGLYDSLLTPRAYQQLPCLAKRFENVPLAAVYASPLFRARTTAQAVAAPHGLTVELRNDLHEIDMGDWEDLPWAELPHGWPDQYAKWCARPWEAAPPHGETVMQAGARMLNEVRRLAQENDGKAIAVVTHGSAIRGALTGIAARLLAAAVLLWVRRNIPDGVLSTLLLALILVELGSIIPTIVVLKQRLNEIEGGEEDAAAQY